MFIFMKKIEYGLHHNNNTTTDCYIKVSYSSFAVFSPIQNQLIPDQHRENIISHVVMTHNMVGEYSAIFGQKLRRFNYVTPKNYLDYIKTYSSLLDEKDNYILGQVWRGLLCPV